MMAGIVYGSGKNVYATFSSPVVLPGGGDAGKSLFVAVSRDGGRTWGVAHEVAAGGPTADPGPSYTLPTIGVDPARRGGPRRDIVYVAADTTTPAHTSPPLGGPSTPPPTEEDIAMSVSKNGGATWSAVFNVNAPGTNATEQTQPVVGATGPSTSAGARSGRGPGRSPLTASSSSRNPATMASPGPASRARW